MLGLKRLKVVQRHLLPRVKTMASKMFIIRHNSSLEKVKAGESISKRKSRVETLSRLSLPKLAISAQDLANGKRSSNEQDENQESKKPNNGQISIENCPPALKEVRYYMNKHPGKVVLTELGKFYELYFENADEFGPKLNLRVAKKQYAWGKISMAGFPTQNCLKYVDQLVNVLNVSVVIIKQYMKDPVIHNTNVKKFYRKVYRIVTPGTIIEQDMLDSEKNNFLLSVYIPKQLLGDSSRDFKIGLSWCDISTTEFYVQQTSLSDLLNDLHRIKPSEIVINQMFQDKLLNQFSLNFRHFNVNWFDANLKNYNLQNYISMFSEKKQNTIEEKFQTYTKTEKNSIFFLLDYIREQFELEHAEKQEEPVLAKDNKETEIANAEKSEKSTLENTNDAPNIDDAVQFNEIEADSFNFSLPVRKKVGNFMLIDTSAREALEITETIRDRSKKHTLFSTVRRTITPSAARMLRSWLDLPLYDLVELKQRLDFVTLFSDPNLKLFKLRITNALKSLSNQDTMRLLFVISFNSSMTYTTSVSADTANIKLGSNYLNLLKTLETFAEIKNTLMEYYDNSFTTGKRESVKQAMNMLIQKLDVPIDLVQSIKKLINRENLEFIRDQLADQEEGEEQEQEQDTTARELSYITNTSSKKTFFPDMTWIININNIEDKTSPLIQYHNQLEKLMRKMKKLQKEYDQLSQEHQIKNCELRIDNDLPNVYIQFPQKAKLTAASLTDLFDITNTYKQSKTSRNFINKSWGELGYKIMKTIKLIKHEELKVLNTLRLDVLNNFERIKTISATVDYIDNIIGFANLSSELNLTCPTLTKKSVLKIANGRHVMVENSLKDNAVEFQSNDCNISSDGKVGYIISGPNMGGKSTYLRQNAVIVILAQIGCFVPADKATIGLVDKIFTRIGSADDITNNSSTFMVEMMETSHGLVQATKNSLLIFDEIGRGTSNNEGIAMAFGILKYMIRNLNSRFLFATHYAPELHKLILINDSRNDCKIKMNDKVDYYHTKLMSTLLDAYLTKKRKRTVTSNIFNGRFFDHKLVPGISQYSHATLIAKLAGVPDPVISGANEAIKIVERASTLRLVDSTFS